MSYQDIIANFQQQQEAARVANEARYAESLKLYDEIIKQYQPEGGFLKGAEAELGREKTRTVAGQEQKLVSSGLFGTSTVAGLGSKWEAEVGQPARLKLEDVRMGRLAQALGAKAGAIERREDIGPDYATIAALSQQAASRPSRIYQQPVAKDDWEIPPDPDWWGAKSPFGGRPSTPARPAGYGPSTPSGLATPTNVQTPQEYWQGTTQTGTSGMQMTNAELQALLAKQPGAGGKQFDPTMGMLDYATAVKLGVQPAAGAMGAGGTTGGGPPHVQGFKDYYNYASTLYRQTGEKLSQQGAFSKLKGMGWRG